MAQAELATTLDLPEDVVCPIAGAGGRRVVEGVDRRKPVLQTIDQAHHSQAAMLSKLEQIGRDVAMQKEVLVLLAAILVHPAAGVAIALILQI